MLFICVCECIGYVLHKNINICYSCLYIYIYIYIYIYLEAVLKFDIIQVHLFLVKFDRLLWLLIAGFSLINYLVGMLL